MGIFLLVVPTRGMGIWRGAYSGKSLAGTPRKRPGASFLYGAERSWWSRVVERFQ